jgi:chaperonin GroES
LRFETPGMPEASNGKKKKKLDLSTSNSLSLSSSPPPKTFSIQLTPRGEYVLCAVAEIETKTTSGVMLPTSAQRVPTSGDVVALGDGIGAAGEFGSTPRQFELKPGDTVLYSKFGLGCTDVTVGGQPHILLRESDVIGTMPRSNATAGDVPELKPLGDRVLLKVQPAADVTAGGVVLPDSAKEKPIVGVVVAAGPGKRAGDRGGPKGADKDAKDPNERRAPKVKVGDRVLYFKWAGDQMETPEGEQYVVLHESDILCKQG